MTTKSPVPPATFDEMLSFDDRQREPLTRDEWDAAGERLRAAREAALARQPKSCPNCGSDSGIYPNFPDDRTWSCADCGWAWEVPR